MALYFSYNIAFANSQDLILINLYKISFSDFIAYSNSFQWVLPLWRLTFNWVSVLA